MKAAEYRTRVAAAMLEATLTEHVRELAEGYRLRRYHTYDSRRSPEGWVDEVLIGPRGILFRELKQDGKSPTPAQRECIEGLAAGGLDVDVWRPRDLVSGRIAREMAAIA